MESRVFVTRDEATLLKDGAVILENMGYKTEMVDPGLGLVTATKREENGGFVSTVMSVLSAGLASSGNQTLSQAAFTTLPAKDGKGAFITRLTLHKITLDSDGNPADAKMITDKDVYKIFYERLEASTFIEPDRL